MRIDSNPSLMTSALLTMQSGEQAILHAARQTASGNVDNLAEDAVAMMSAQRTNKIGVKLAQVADDMMKSTIDMLA